MAHLHLHMANDGLPLETPFTASDPVLEEDRDAVFLLDAALRIEGINRSAEALLGFHREELAGKSVAVVLGHPSRVTATSRNMEDLLRGERPVTDLPLVLVTREGARIDVRFTRVRLGDGMGRERVMCVARPLREASTPAREVDSTFSLPRLLEEVRESAATRMGRRDIVLQVDPSLPEELQGETDRLRRVLLLLVAEVSRGAGSSGTRIRATRESSPASGTHRVRVLFSVRGSDNDLSLAESTELEHIIAGTPEGVHGHAGLRRCCELVRLLDGEIRIDTDPSWGTELHVAVVLDHTSRHLPEARIIDGMAAAEAEESTSVTTPTRRLLVVAYSRVQRLLLTRMLERQGHEVDAAGCGLEALERMPGNAYDMVVVEGRLPDMHPHELGEAVRRRCPKEATPRVLGILAPGSDKGDLDAMVVKPAESDHLAQAIRDTLS